MVYLNQAHLKIESSNLAHNSKYDFDAVTIILQTGNVVQPSCFGSFVFSTIDSRSLLQCEETLLQAEVKLKVELKVNVKGPKW